MKEFLSHESIVFSRDFCNRDSLIAEMRMWIRTYD